MNRENIYKYFDRHQILIAISLFTITFLIVYLPFFIYIPVPAIGWDTYGYFWFAERIAACNLPVSDAPIEMGVGFPLLIAICKLFSLNIIGIVVIQTLIFYSACIYLIFAVSNLCKKASLIASLAMSLYVLQPLIMSSTTLLYTESLYCSTLIFLVATIFRHYYKQNIYSFALLLFAVSLGILVRSNAIINYFLPFVIVLFIVKDSKKRKQYIASIIVMFVFISMFNYFFRGFFFPGDINRVKEYTSYFAKKLNIGFLQKEKNNNDWVIERKSSLIDVTESGRKTYLIEAKTRNGRDIVQIRYSESTSELFKNYLSQFSRTKPSFYYSLMPTTYEYGIINKRPEVDSVLFDGYYYIDELSPTLRNFVFSNYNYKLYLNDKYQKSIDYYAKDRKILMLITHYLYQIIDKLKINFLIHVLFFFIFFYAVYYCFKNRTVNNQYFYFILVSLIYLLLYLILPIIGGRHSERYLFVTEFIVYLNALLGLAVLIQDVIKKKAEKSIDKRNSRLTKNDNLIEVDK
ncbi:MAG: hypothetical protein PHT69_11795 [Bacteroidales bacterium]|nr:hypothetical protein [Bacteroidales bacterium]